MDAKVVRERIVELRRTRPWIPPFFVGGGWVDLLEPFVLLLEEWREDRKFPVRIFQIKEKFGQLTVYLDPPEVADGDQSRSKTRFNHLVDLANGLSSLSMFVCEDCGKRGRGMYGALSMGWVKTMCEDCRRIREDRGRMSEEREEG